MTDGWGGAVPRLSVVIPARNSSPWIGELVESIVTQDVPGLELVLVDNGSEDETTEIAQAAVGGRAAIRVVRSGASSAAAARNEGVAVASGEYLVFADADDLVPDGAYHAMLSSLEASGSDMVIGDHLKFSAGSTWSPTRRWWAFDRPLTAVRAVDVPQLLSGRACWNRMFRRTFWDAADLRFPEIPSLEDVLPMTSAFVEAATIDVVAECVYLYRDRTDASSLSRLADVESTLRYFEQERRCVALTADSDVLSRQHAEVILDADGWAHLERFLRTGPARAEVAAVSAAARELVGALPVGGLNDLPASRRALWLLILHDLGDAAVHFARASAGHEAQMRVSAWVRAVVDLSPVAPQALGALTSDGLVPAFVNGADQLDTSELAAHLDVLGTVGAGPGGSELANAMASALTASDPTLVQLVSSLRHILPLVVSRVPVTARGLTVAGDASLSALGSRLTLVFDGPARAELRLEEDGTAAGWSAAVPADLLPKVGRYGVRALVEGVEGTFPVVTARMPLPPLDDRYPLQPLADRKDGWRFIVDRRASRRGLSELAARLRATLRHGGGR